jgi:hypothetical protein
MATFPTQMPRNLASAGSSAAIAGGGGGGAAGTAAALAEIPAATGTATGRAGVPGDGLAIFCCSACACGAGVKERSSDGPKYKATRKTPANHAALVLAMKLLMMFILSCGRRAVWGLSRKSPRDVRGCGLAQVGGKVLRQACEVDGCQIGFGGLVLNQFRDDGADKARIQDLADAFPCPVPADEILHGQH